jgi:hypothetical protein
MIAALMLRSLWLDFGVRIDQFRLGKCLLRGTRNSYWFYCR